MAQLRVSDALSNRLVTAATGARYADIMAEASGLHATHVVVFENSVLRGLIQLQDAISALSDQVFGDQLGSTSPATIRADAPLDAAVLQMRAVSVDAMCVLNADGSFAGAITLQDALDALQPVGQLAASSPGDLQSNRAKLRAILDNAVDGIITIDARGVVEQFNLGAERMFGYKASEVVGKNVSLLMPSPDREKHDDYMKRYARTRRARIIGIGRETVGRRKDGAEFPLDLAISEICVEGQDWFTAFVRDISERKESERKLQEHTERLEAANRTLEEREQALRQQAKELRELHGAASQRTLELGEVTVAARSAKRSLTLVSKASERLFACTSIVEVAHALTDSLVRGFSAYFARLWLTKPGDVCGACTLVGHCPDKRVCLHLVGSAGHYTHLDGEHRRVPLGAFKIGLIAQGRGRTICNDVPNDERVHDRTWAAEHKLRSFAGFPLVLDGKVVGVMAMFSRKFLPDHLLDAMELLARLGALAVTNVGQLEESRVAEAEAQRLSSFPEENPHPVLELNRNGTIGYYNPGAILLLERLGLAEGRADRLLPDDYRVVANRCLRERCDVTISEHHNLGRIFTWAFHPVPGCDLIHVYGQDVTEQRQAKAALRLAREQADGANRAKSMFLADMSHEIRTPMTAILGYAELLLDSDASASARLDGVQTIRRNGEHLLTLINDILDLSKLEAGKLQVELESCHTRRVIHDVASLLDIRAAERRIKLVIEQDGPIPDVIRSDATRLRQALLNLVGNAIKFSGESDVRIVVSSQPDVETMTFQIIDQGVGMATAQAAAVFQPFTQASVSVARKYGGTGLGLAITKRIAELLGGDVSVKSAPGEGSTFTLVVATGSLSGVEMVKTLDLPNRAQTPARSARDLPKLDAHILLVEDGPDNRRLITYMLTKSGANVTTALNGEEAVTMALAAERNGEPFNLILMDIEMPVMDGYTATRTLRAAGYTAPIVALSAHAMKGEAQRCLAVGCDQYLSKPIDREILIREVARHVRPSA